MEIQGLDHIVLRTNKLQAMIDFYCNVLSCSVERSQEAIHLVQLRAGRHLIDIIEVNDEVATTHRNMEHFCLRVSYQEGDELIAYLQANNIEYSRAGERFGAQGLSWSLYIKDPQGNEVELTVDKGVEA